MYTASPAIKLYFCEATQYTRLHIQLHTFVIFIQNIG